jgi:hypothetical protein
MLIKERSQSAPVFLPHGVFSFFLGQNLLKEEGIDQGEADLDHQIACFVRLAVLRRRELIKLLPTSRSRTPLYLGFAHSWNQNLEQEGKGSQFCLN